MLIAWTGALVNSSNVFLSIKGSKLRVLKELVTIDFARRVAFRVHYMGALSPYFWWQGHCTNNRELGVSISLLLFFFFSIICCFAFTGYKVRAVANEYYLNEIDSPGLFHN